VPDTSDWYSVAPDCIKNTGDLGSGFENLAAPFQDCHGFFTFGAGTQYAGAPGVAVPEGGTIGAQIGGASTALWIITAIGFLVSIGAFVAWVWFENKKLWAQAMLLRAAGGMPAPGGVPPGPSPSQPPLAGPSTEPGE
jgi:hypothetical protein